jgi:hypothetical protein
MVDTSTLMIAALDKIETNAIPKVAIDSAQVTNIFNATLAIAGIVTVIFIIIGGIQYATSSGDSQAVSRAKDTILYAIIGLVVVMSAFVIVRLVTGIV